MYITKITLRPKTGSSSKPNAHNYFHRARIYVTPANETVMENLVHGRHTRPYNQFKKDILPKLFKMLGLHNVEAGWSQKAGCSTCPCSPGFIVKSDNVPYDIFVTFTDKYTTKDVEIHGSLSS